MQCALGTQNLSPPFPIMWKWAVSRVCSGCPYLKIGVVRTVQNSHVTLFCSIPLVFRKSGVLQTVNGEACGCASLSRNLVPGYEVVLSRIAPYFIIYSVQCQASLLVKRRALALNGLIIYLFKIFQIDIEIAFIRIYQQLQYYPIFFIWF
jgi:hypothetical protein